MNENTAMADAFFGIFGLRRIEMVKRDVGEDLGWINTRSGTIGTRPYWFGEL